MNDQELSSYLAKALVILLHGSNDYINNYLLPSIFSTGYVYSPEDYADMLVKRYTRKILVTSTEINNFVSPSKTYR